MAKHRPKSVLTQRQTEVAEQLLDGEKPPIGSTMAKRPLVAQYMQDKRNELSDALQIRRADVVEGIKDAIEMARISADPMAMIRGWSEIAKILGLNAPEVKKLEISVGARNTLTKYASLSDEELIAIVEGRAPAPAIDGEYTDVTNASTIQ